MKIWIVFIVVVHGIQVLLVGNHWRCRQICHQTSLRSLQPMRCGESPVCSFAKVKKERIRTRGTRSLKYQMLIDHSMLVGFWSIFFFLIFVFVWWSHINRNYFAQFFCSPQVIWNTIHQIHTRRRDFSKVFGRKPSIILSNNKIDWPNWPKSMKSTKKNGTWEQRLHLTSFHSVLFVSYWLHFN